MSDKYPLEVLQPHIQDYVNIGSQCIQVDPSFIAPHLLTTIANAIGRKRCINIDNNQYTCPAILWTCSVGTPSSRKSPAWKWGLRPLREFVSSEHQKYKAARALWEELKKKPEEPTYNRYSVDDATIEALARLFDKNSALLVASDELDGWISSHGQYKSGNADTAKYLQMYDGDLLEVDRVRDNLHIIVENAHLCVSGTTQPEVLTKIGKTNTSNGFLSRILLMMPDTPPKSRIDRNAIPNADNFIELLANQIRQLVELQYDPDPRKADRPTPIQLGIDDATYDEVWQPFTVDTIPEWQRMAGPAKSLAYAYGKMEGIAARFALILALLDNPNARLVSRDVMERAIKLTTWHANETFHVYEKCGLLPIVVADEDTALLEYLRIHTNINTVRDLARNKSRSAEVIRKMLDNLANMGHVKWVNEKKTSFQLV